MVENHDVEIACVRGVEAFKRDEVLKVALDERFIHVLYVGEDLVPRNHMLSDGHVEGVNQAEGFLLLLHIKRIRVGKLLSAMLISDAKLVSCERLLDAGWA